MSIFEAAMLICFGVSWPVSIARSIRTRVVIGKSPVFMLIVAAGYLLGIIHKLLYARDILVWLYAFNMSMVLFDFGLYLFFLPDNRDLIKEHGTLKH